MVSYQSVSFKSYWGQKRRDGKKMTIYEILRLLLEVRKQKQIEKKKKVLNLKWQFHEFNEFGGMIKEST